MADTSGTSEVIKGSEMKRIAYLTKKVQQKIRHMLFAESSKFIRIIKRKSNSTIPAKICFYLDNQLFIHLGDQFFFEPALRLTAKKFDVYIRPTPDMAEYFVMSGAKVINDEKIFDGDILITREELLPDVLHRTRADIISINTLAENMGYRISEAITYSVAQFLEIEIPQKFDFTPWKPPIAQQRVAAEKVILAPFVESGWFRVWKSDIEQLSLHAKKFADECGFSLCLVGGKTDVASKMPPAIGTDFEDWRGRFSPCQFAQILASGQIARVYTFDTFVFHAAVAYDIPVTVKIRRSFPKKKQFIKKYILPSYSGANTQIDFL